MKRTVYHAIEFTAQEIKDALIIRLRDEGIYPNGEHSAEEFTMKVDGAKITWSEIVDL